MERLTEMQSAYGWSVRVGSPLHFNGSVYVHGEHVDRLASYEDALTLPDGTVMGPSEVAALRARREAAEADLESVADGATICGVCDQTWCSACDGYNQFKWRGPQEGATAHERV